MRVSEFGKNGLEKKLPPEVNVSPDDLIGHIVQISLAEDQMGGTTKLIPPLRVIEHARSKDHHAILEDVEPLIYFSGKALEDFLEDGQFADELSYVSSDTIFLFYSEFNPFQPHNCLDPRFLDYLERNQEWIPVTVYCADLEGKTLTRDFMSSRRNFGYMDYGVLQLFVPQKGFVSPWPSRYPHREMLQTIEQILVSRYQAQD